MAGKMMVNHKHQASGEMDIGVTEARVPKIGQVKQLYKNGGKAFGSSHVHRFSTFFNIMYIIWATF
jgi:hypothetical protein